MKIEPHVGIGPVRLGAKRNAARAALAEIGMPLEVSKERIDYFPGIQVEYTSDLVSFIGVSWNERYVATYHGVDVFDLAAEDLFSSVALHDKTGDHMYNTYDYVFPNQILTLWDADEQYDRIGKETRTVWAQVGLGNDIYLGAVTKVERGDA